jgi:uncharacterized membrane protein
MEILFIALIVLVIVVVIFIAIIRGILRINDIMNELERIRKAVESKS